MARIKDKDKTMGLGLAKDKGIRLTRGIRIWLWDKGL